jgi:hypothetical protein
VKRKEVAVGLFFMTRYDVDSAFFFVLTSEPKRKIHQRVETHHFKNSSPRGEGESKRKRKFDEKAAAGWFRSMKLIPCSRLVLPVARSF